MRYRVTYGGIIGVPTSYLKAQCTEQFELVGATGRYEGFGPIPTRTYDEYQETRPDGTLTGCNGKKVNGSAMLEGIIPNKNYYTEGTRYANSLFSRLFIRRIT